MTNTCPCGSKQAYIECCRPYHQGAIAPTAEKLMRSRYAAYVVGKIDYIAATNDPETGHDFDAEAASEWSKESEWLGLDVIASEKGQASDDQGVVEFKAKYRARSGGEEQIHHEVSLFRRDPQSGRWYYRDGKTVREPVRRTEPKAGRNDPCPCGSGKKYKKCCGE
jgi:SEC-C motif-containing protein